MSIPMAIGYVAVIAVIVLMVAAIVVLLEWNNGRTGSVDNP
jgi:hypothetical protein